LEQKRYYDRSVKSLPSLHPNDSVRLCQKGKWKPAVVIDLDEAPRSYHVRTPDGSTFRRNRRHLLHAPKSEGREQITVAEPTMAETTLMTNVEGLHESPAKVMYERNTEQCHPTDHVKTRSGRIVKKPKRFDDYEL
jgi:hypothetical protein